MDTIKIENKAVKMVAHRGLSGIEKENTCSAFVAACNRATYFAVETDVHRTVDGQFVIFHDDNTARVGLDHLVIEESTFETLRKLQLVVVPPRRRAVQLQHPPPQPVGVAAGLVLRRQRDVGPLGQELHRLRERQALDLHDEIDDAAALFAAEAVVDLLVRRYGKRGRFLVVEGAQAEQVAALARQRHVAGYHVRDVVPRHHFVQKLVAEMHEKPSFPPPNRSAK